MNKTKMRYIQRSINLITLSMILIIGIAISGCIQNSTNQTNASSGHNQIINPNEIRFMLVGDPHVKSSSGGVEGRGNERLRSIVKFADKSDIDFIVFLGDEADDGKNRTLGIVKNILNNLTKPYYVVAGNHDIIVSPNLFENYFGPMEHVENVKGYQLLFVGIWNETNYINPKTHGKVILHWKFDFNNSNKSMPTIIFSHGPSVNAPMNATACNWGTFFGYANTMQPELNKFSNLLAEYAGHVHYDTDQTINGIRYVTVNGLVNKAGGCENEGASNYVGYSDIKNGKVDFALINYSEPFKNPFSN